MEEGNPRHRHPGRRWQLRCHRRTRPARSPLVATPGARMTLSRPAGTPKNGLALRQDKWALPLALCPRARQEVDEKARCRDDAQECSEACGSRTFRDTSVHAIHHSTKGSIRGEATAEFFHVGRGAL